MPRIMRQVGDERKARLGLNKPGEANGGPNRIEPWAVKSPLTSGSPEAGLTNRAEYVLFHPD
jgi:hypothetical protein